MEWGLGCCCGGCDAAGICIGGKLPPSVDIIIADPGGGTYACRSLCYGTFSCTAPRACEEYSSLAKRVEASGCVLHTTARRMSIFFRGNIVAEVYDDTKIGTVNYNPVAGLAARYSIGGSGLNCLASITLEKVSTDISGFPFPTTITIQPTP